jgi:hypothetical protein
MTPARLLVVAWMACVFALGVWHHPIVPSLCAGPAILPADVAASETPAHAIKRYLRVHYDDVYVRDGGDVVETGLAYADEAPLDEVHDDLLRRLLPRTRFFRTWLRNGDQHDITADTIVSFRHTPEGDDIRSFAITEEGRLRKFLGQFIGVVAPDRRAKRDVALAIATLLSADLDNPTATLAFDPKRPDLARVQVRRREWHWCNIDVVTDHDGRVAQLVLQDPMAFGPIFSVY